MNDNDKTIVIYLDNLLLEICYFLLRQASINDLHRRSWYLDESLIAVFIRSQLVDGFFNRCF
ncbi:hypothetical protein [Bartonella rattaustraliani]|uniref:hypothetical protein n=1 Tax=Bartonella rattaustraliani TaxID=481139 RepID=UPI0012EA8F53|nr:hypothetical protein [Bartonella rattaustraliani]